ncbi:MAG TPA: ATP-binding domain-containing protein, partial [Candidatus Ozemobacteraceae bacterium]|nr:ATP-binding domain-containing protein [Candidatus Ozemobacteraceae bacterium]
GPEMLDIPAEAVSSAFLPWWFDRFWRFPDELQERIRHPFVWDDTGSVAHDSSTLNRLFRQVLSSRLLTATHQGAGGTEALNLTAGQLYRRLTGRGAHESLIPGEPLLMTRNEYLYDVFNGDQGLLLWAITPTSPSPALHAVFPRHHGFQAIPFEALRHDLEPAYALTVHKSQGSEFDRVFLVLPPVDHPLLTREILYTGVTRARSGVVLVGSREALNSGMRRSIKRRSRLQLASPTT